MNPQAEQVMGGRRTVTLGSSHAFTARLSASGSDWGWYTIHVCVMGCSFVGQGCPRFFRFMGRSVGSFLGFLFFMLRTLVLRYDRTWLGTSATRGWRICSRSYLGMLWLVHLGIMRKSGFSVNYCSNAVSRMRPVVKAC